MKRPILSGLITAFLLSPCIAFSKEPIAAKYGFIENKGQLVDQAGNDNPEARYLLHTPALNVQLRQAGFSYDAYTLAGSGSYQYHRVDVLFDGANPNARIIAEAAYPGYLNYYLNGRAVTGVHHYNKVTYQNLYNGIDLEFVTGGNGKDVEYNFIVHPGADASVIKMRYVGANDLALRNGKLDIKLAHGLVTESIPASYIADTRVPVAVQYAQASGNIFGYSIGAYDKSKTLIIDPTPDVAWSVNYGGSGDDEGKQITTHGNNIFIAGNTKSSTNIATTGAHQTTISTGTDAFIAAMDNQHVTQWGTYYGGAGEDFAYSIVADKNGNLIVGGQTSSSTGFTSSTAHQTTLGGTSDAFVLVLNGSGQRQWCTYYGDMNDETGYGVSVDGSNNIYLTGITNSPIGLGTTGVQQEMFSGGLTDGFLVKFNSTGSLQWGTYVGDMDNDHALSVAADGAGNVYVAGVTYNPQMNSLVTTGSHQEAYGGDTTDYFITKYDGTDGTIIWGTYYGGMAGEVLEHGKKLAVDASNNLYFVGATYSSDTIATAGAFQATQSGTSKDGFIAKFNSNGVRQWGTYFGAGSDDGVTGITVGASGSIYTIGNTNGTSGLASVNAYQNASGGGDDVYVAKFDGTGARVWSTYLGGTGKETGYGITTDASERVYVAGTTTPTGPTANANAFITRLKACISVTITNTSTITDAGCFGDSKGVIDINATGGQPPYSYRINTGGGFKATDTFTNLPAGAYVVEIMDDNGCVATSEDTVRSLPEIQQPVISGSTTAGAFTKHEYTETANSPVGSYTYAWGATPGVGIATQKAAPDVNKAEVLWGNILPAEVWVVVSSGPGCSDTGRLAANIIASSVDDVTGETNMSVYPNPATEYVTVKLQALPANERYLMLYDNAGKLVRKQEVRKEQKLFVGDLPAGVYHLQIGNVARQITKY